MLTENQEKVNSFVVYVLGGKMENYSDLIDRCKKSEGEAVIKGLAMGAVILSRMGPIYKKGCVAIFQELAMQFAPTLNSITSIADFDDFHESFIQAVIGRMRPEDYDKLTWGEAQKSINVFLKNYIDRSSLPNELTANRIRPFLHVPLDSVMIKYFRKTFPFDYEKYISPEHRIINQQFKASHPNAFKIPDSLLSELKYIFKEVYLAWQKWFRDIYPEKPVLLDTIWALEREKD